MNEVMYRRPKFLEILLEIRQEMSREADYDVDLFAEMIRSGKFSEEQKNYELNEAATTEEPSKTRDEKSKI